MVAGPIAMFGTTSLVELGAILAGRASSSIADGLAARQIPAPSGGGHNVPTVQDLPAPVAHVVEHAYGSGIELATEAS